MFRKESEPKAIIKSISKGNYAQRYLDATNDLRQGCR